LSRFADAPLLSVDLAEGASVDDLLAALGAQQPSLAPALAAALPVLAGTHAERDQTLHAGDEVALLIPVAGGAGYSGGQPRRPSDATASPKE
jgi:molybdopterin converting factor small subunit